MKDADICVDREVSPWFKEERIIAKKRREENGVVQKQADMFFTV